MNLILRCYLLLCWLLRLADFIGSQQLPAVSFPSLPSLTKFHSRLTLFPSAKPIEKRRPYLIHTQKVLASATLTVETTDYTFPSNAKFAETPVLTTATCRIRINTLTKQVHSLHNKTAKYINSQKCLAETTIVAHSQ